MKHLAIVFGAYLFLASASAAGPFGLTMGQTGHALDTGQNIGVGVYVLNSVPSPHPDFGRYSALVTPVSGLCAIVAETESFGRDGVRGRYELIRRQLEEKYGRFTVDEETLAGKWFTSAPQDWEGIRQIELSLIGTKVALRYRFSNEPDCAVEAERMPVDSGAL